jgi:hypothetical protein
MINKGLDSSFTTESVYIMVIKNIYQETRVGFEWLGRK